MFSEDSFSTVEHVFGTFEHAFDIDDGRIWHWRGRHWRHRFLDGRCGFLNGRPNVYEHFVIKVIEKKPTKRDSCYMPFKPVSANPSKYKLLQPTHLLLVFHHRYSRKRLPYTYTSLKVTCARAINNGFQRFHPHPPLIIQLFVNG